jgi:hypothetical protein
MKLKFKAGGSVYCYEMTNRAIARFSMPSYVDSWSLNFRGNFAYADLEPANTLLTLRPTIKMKGVIKEH